jgi:RNA polymerase sigma factor (sigma-70 family)
MVLSMSYPQSWYPDPVTLTKRVRAAQLGDQRAVSALLESLRPAFVAFFERRLPHDEAEDLTQIALLRIANALQRIDPDRASGYVTTVLRNLMRTARKRHVRDESRRSSLDVFLVDARMAPADAQCEFEELARAVYRVAATSLPPALSEIVFGLMRGETTAEIAKQYAVSPVTVRTRLLRARAIMRRELSARLTCDGDMQAKAMVVESKRQRRSAGI